MLTAYSKPAWALQYIQDFDLWFIRRWKIKPRILRICEVTSTTKQIILTAEIRIIVIKVLQYIVRNGNYPVVKEVLDPFLLFC